MLDNNSNYPAGANISSAPWNQSDPDQAEFELRCDQTLSKTMPIFSSNYTVEVDEEADEEGHRIREAVYNTDTMEWEEEFQANGYHTPLQLLGLFKQYLQDIKDGTKNANYNPREIQHLISECENWEEVDVCYDEG